MMDSDEFNKCGKQFDAGSPAITLDADYLRSAWHKWNGAHQQWNDPPNVATGAGTMGLDDGVHTAEQAHAAWIRLTMLDTLSERGVLAGYVNGHHVADEVFLAAATIPCTKDDLAEAIILRRLLDVPPDVAAQSRQEMRAGGYDPDHPLIDGKFLDWMRKVTG